MSFNLSDVSQAAHGEPEELSVKGAGDRLANRGLPDTRRAYEADDLAFDRPAKLADCQELQNAVFHVFQAIMVFIENLLSMSDRVVFGRVLTPRDL